MKREEQEFLERDEGNESHEEEPVIDQQADGLEDEFDREFWIKVPIFNLRFFKWTFLKNLNSEFGLFLIVYERNYN